MIFCSVQDAVNLLTLFKYLSSSIVSLLSRTSIDGSIFYLYYLYCLSIFQRTCCFRFKSGCKGKGFIFNYQTFSEVFFIFSFYSFLRLSMRKGKNVLKKNKGRFLCESDCKDKNFIYYPPKLFGSFFVLFFKHNFAFSLCQFCKAFFSWKAGAKVRPFSIQSKYIKLFFLSFF
ncbi:hypothetical protein BOVAC2_2054 [Bacteroides ovatus]|nr:hypothetical protein BOVAC2_2054 [Bacteroides ovatus]